MLDKIISKKKELTYKLKIHIRKKAIKQFEKKLELLQKKELKNINIKQLLVFIKNVPVNHTKEASKMNKFMEYLNKKKIPFKRKLPSADGKYFIMIK